MTGKQSSPMKTLKRKELLYQTVQEEIKAYIVRNDLKPGDFLPTELELSHQLGVGRSSIREAVKSLTTLRIIDARPGAGLFVCDFSFEPLLKHMGYGMLFGLRDLQDVLDVRLCLETGMAEEVVRASTPEQISRLRSILSRMYDMAEQGQHSPHDDRKLHQVLWENVDNAILGKLLDIFWMVFLQAQERASIPGPGNPMDAYHRHLSIVDDLERGDVEAFRADLASHYITFEEGLRKVYEGRAEHHDLHE